MLVTGAKCRYRQIQTHLTKIVDEGYGIFELRVGSTNIARVFWFYQPGQRTILTNGYVKKSQKLDSGELATAREYKRDWEARRGGSA